MSADIAALIEEHRGILKSHTDNDAYLSEVAQRFQSHRFLGRSTQAVFRRQIEFLGRILEGHLRRPPATINVLDWGCGKGHISYLLKERGFVVTSCDRRDVSDDSAFGQGTPIIDEKGITVIGLDDPVELPFESASFDCVASFGVLEHVEDDMSSMREIRRVLKPGGLFYVTFLPYKLSWTQALARLRGNSYHDRLYTCNRVQKLASQAQFTVEGAWLGQLFPKNSVPLWLDPILERLDRSICRYTPFKYFATNLEAVLTAS